MIWLDVLVPCDRFNPDTGKITRAERVHHIAITPAMGVRVSEDDEGRCWISLADNSLWRSPHDLSTTADMIGKLTKIALDELKGAL